ncbi:MAG: beta-lactamase family protein [Gemmatimonadota bacterium]|nr:beta-lactamase family protein [Gemmatimonadota bacterium]MDH4349688.1 beta-lactamase family protein [Gemmatimonadota bacterium]MDH5196865.1 beta-lactamase family protein [Gemmatimonadota bacterium]
MVIVLGLLLAVQDPTAVDRAVLAGISAGAFPGAVVVVGSRDGVLLGRGYGHFTWDTASAVPDPEWTLFDLASLTKVVATTTSIMLLADRGQVALQQPVQRYLPEFQGDGKDRVTVRQLLEHRSGLRAFLRLDTLARDAAEAKQIVLAEPLSYPPGSRVVYSDLNAMLLGWIVEVVAETTLDAFAAREVLAPLGMTRARFGPTRRQRDSIMPVGRWRGHPIAGEVHDQNAARLGGVSGHAGLYATGMEVGRLAQFMLRRGVAADGTTLVRPGVVDAFVRRGPGNRAIGWEMRDTTSTDNSGQWMSAATYGHTGYTGTSIWIDPDRDLYVVLLTNRVFAPRTGRSISELKRVRGAVADAAVLLVEACRPAGTCPRADPP